MQLAWSGSRLHPGEQRLHLALKVCGDSHVGEAKLSAHYRGHRGELALAYGFQVIDGESRCQIRRFVLIGHRTAVDVDKALALEVELQRFAEARGILRIGHRPTTRVS